MVTPPPLADGVGGAAVLIGCLAPHRATTAPPVKLNAAVPPAVAAAVKRKTDAFSTFTLAGFNKRLVLPSKPPLQV
jgi:hypothetical protein